MFYRPVAKMKIEVSGQNKKPCVIKIIQLYITLPEKKMSKLTLFIGTGGTEASQLNCR